MKVVLEGQAKDWEWLGVWLGGEGVEEVAGGVREGRLVLVGSYGFWRNQTLRSIAAEFGSGRMLGGLEVGDL